jgi:hypothetical protein
MVPNVCKMPGPPAPFVPTPLPNLGTSDNDLQKCTNDVTFEGKKVAVKGAYYMSRGDMASQGTGGGIISAKVHGKTEFVAPGSMNVKAEGKNVQLLGDAMTNNGGSPSNSANLGNMQGVTPHIQACANALCDAMCDAIKNKESSNDLEKRCQNDPDMKRLGLKFRTFAWLKVAASTAARYGRSVRNVVTVFGEVLLKPDVVLLGAAATLGAATAAGSQQIFGKVAQCFEIKLPGDAVGRGTDYADQIARQRQLSGGQPVIKIACPGPPNYGVCESCPHC